MAKRHDRTKPRKGAMFVNLGRDNKRQLRFGEREKGLRELHALVKLGPNRPPLARFIPFCALAGTDLQLKELYGIAPANPARITGVIEEDVNEASRRHIERELNERFDAIYFKRERPDFGTAMAWAALDLAAGLIRERYVAHRPNRGG